MQAIAQNDSSRRFMSVKQAADYLGLSVNTLYSWKSQGLYLPVVTFGRRVMIDVDDLEAFIASNKHEPRDLDDLIGDAGGRVQ